MNTTNTCCTPTRPASTAIQRPATEAPTRSFVPAVDMTEGPDAYILTADIPGARAEDVNIQLERGVLTLNAAVPRRGSEKPNFVLNEYGVGNYTRTFRVGDGIEVDEIDAHIADGVLTLRLPKAEALKPRRVEVKPG